MAAASTEEPTVRPLIPFTRWGWPELVGVALVHRLAIALWTFSIAPDCVRYFPAAEHFRDGRMAQALESDLHPLYPWLTGILARLTGSIEFSAVATAVVAGSLMPAFLFLILRRIWSERVAWVTGFLCALQPVLALDTTEAYPTALFLSLFFASAACGLIAHVDRRWWLYPVAGVLAGLCYLTRTEGIHAAGFLCLGAVWVLVGSFLRSPSEPTTVARKRLVLIAGVLAGAIAFGVVSYPYLSYIRERTGRWGFTLKGGKTLMDKAVGVPEEEDQEARTAAEAISEHYSLPGFMGRKLAKALFGPLVPFYVVGLFCVHRQQGSWAKMAPFLVMAIVAFIPSLLLLGLGPNHMPSHRYMLLTGLLLLPWAAAGVLTLVDVLNGRVAFLRRRGLAPVLLLLLVLLPLKSVRPRRPEEVTYKEAGRWISAQSLGHAPTIVSGDAKVSYYGRCRHVDLPSQWTDPNRPPPELHARKTPLKFLEPAEALDWARRAREAYLRSGASLLIVDQRSVDHFFGPNYLKELETVGFRRKTVIERDPQQKAWTIWVFSLEKSG